MAHAYPGTEFYDYAKSNGFIVNEGSQMVDEGGHQLAMIEYPGLPRDYVMEMVHRFYDEYYFRPKAIFRIVRKVCFRLRRAQAPLQRSEGLHDAACGAQSRGERSAQPAQTGRSSSHSGHAHRRTEDGNG